MEAVENLSKNTKEQVDATSRVRNVSLEVINGPNPSKLDTEIHYFQCASWDSRTL